MNLVTPNATRATNDPHTSATSNVLVTSEGDAATLGCKLVGIEKLLAESDIVTLHCPSTEETRGLINEETVQSMKPGSILINVGRGDLVRLDALTAALKNGQLAGAGLDVFDPEPIPTDSALLSMQNVIVTSHIASASPKAARKLRESVAKIAVAAVRGEPLPNIVNGL